MLHNTDNYSHLGHNLWNEITGLDYLLRHVAANKLPTICIVNPDLTEMHGRLDEILPDLKGTIPSRMNRNQKGYNLPRP